MSHRLEQLNLSCERRRGFSLAEMVVALGILAILLGAAGMTLSASLRGTDRGVDAASRAREAAEALDFLTADVAVAVAWTTRTATRLEFTVPNRSGGSGTQSVRYSWTGVTGAPLVRSFAGGPETVILSNVQTLNFNVITRAGPVSNTSSAQSLVDVWSTSGGSDSSFKVTGNNQFAQVAFVPTQAGAQSFVISGLELMISSDGATGGSLRVTICQLDANSMPDMSNVLGQAVINESTLPAALARTTLAVTTSAISVGTPIAIVLGNAGSGTSASVATKTGLSGSPANTAYVDRARSSDPWSSASSTTTIRFVLKGNFISSQEQ